MNKDNFNTTKVVLMTAPVAVTGDTTSGACALAGYESASFFVAFGADATPPDAPTNYWHCKLTECATVAGSYTDVAAGDIIGHTANTFGLVNSATDDEKVYGLGYKGRMPFVKVELIEEGAVSSIACVFAVLGHPADAPVGNVVQAS